MEEIPITPRDPQRFTPVIGEERTSEFLDALAEARERLAGHSVWHINSTAAGGGVAEMLHSVLSYPAAAGIDVHWLVVEGNEDFFEVTKRIHHLLHGSEGDGGPLGDAERECYEAALAPESKAVCELVQPGDVVILHDPQTLGLSPDLARRGGRVIWSCHVGADHASDATRRAWDFLRPYVATTEAQGFSRSQYRWEGLDPARVAVIPPCIDAFAPKNEHLDESQAAAILAASGIIASESDASTSPPARFDRQDGSEGHIVHRAQMIEDEPIPPQAPVVCQVSRWDPLKDHIGIMRAFSEQVARELGAHLVLGGPDPKSVEDDPEGPQTLDELEECWRGLEPEARARVHLCCVPMDDLEENAAVINALQRRSDVIVQKSLAEGFGLTVAEAMWKSRPTLGSRVGGIQDQIEDRVTGMLVDPDDAVDFARAVEHLLCDRESAMEMGVQARQRVSEEYLAPSYLTRQFAQISEVLDRPTP